MAEVRRLGKGMSLQTVPPLFAPIWQVAVLSHVRSSQERGSVGGHLASLTYVLCSRGCCDFLLVSVDMAAGQMSAATWDLKRVAAVRQSCLPEYSAYRL